MRRTIGVLLTHQTFRLTFRLGCHSFLARESNCRSSLFWDQPGTESLPAAGFQFTTPPPEQSGQVSARKRWTTFVEALKLLRQSSLNASRLDVGGRVSVSRLAPSGCEMREVA